MVGARVPLDPFPEMIGDTSPHQPVPARGGSALTPARSRWRRESPGQRVAAAGGALPEGIPTCAHSGASSGCGAGVMIRERAMTSMPPDLI